MFGLELLPAIVVALGGIAATLTAIGVIWNKAVRPLWRSVRRGEQIWESVNTIEPFQEEVREFMEFVRHELSYNSGSSVKDMTRETNRLIQDHTSNTDLHRTVQVNVHTPHNNNQQ